MTTLMDACNDLHTIIGTYIPNAHARRTADEALAAIEMALQERPTLTATVEAFCAEVDTVARHEESRGNGGQHVPLHSQLAAVGPGALMALQRYVRHFREALDARTP